MWLTKAINFFKNSFGYNGRDVAKISKKSIFFLHRWKILVKKKEERVRQLTVFQRENEKKKNSARLYLFCLNSAY